MEENEKITSGEPMPDNPVSSAETPTQPAKTTHSTPLPPPSRTVTYVPKMKEKTEYTVKEAIFALISFAFAYFFVDTCLNSNCGLGLFALVCGFAAIVVAYQLINRIKFTVRSIVCLVLLLASGATTFLFDGYLSVDTFFLDMALGLYWLFVSLGGSISKKFDYLAWFDALKSWFILPFSAFGRGFAAFFSVCFGKSAESKKKRVALYVIIGIIVAAIPCSLVVNELMSDAAFSALIEKIFSFDDLNIGETIGKLVLSIPISCYLFGALFSATRSPKKEMFTYESTHTAANEARFIPLLVVCTALTPLLIVYLLYFFSQTAYFVSAFSNILPSGFTYAEYARNGFFELCRVSVINLVVIAAAEIFSRYAGKKPIVLKVYNSILSVFTLALMVIAQSKLAMYIRTYGMTPKRVNTFWFSIVLGVVFFFILLYQFIPKINFTRCAAVSFAVLFCALIFSNTDAMIARYNIEKYKSGETKTLDTDLLCYNLSDSAVPVIIEEYDTLPDESPKKAIDKYFTEWAKRIEIREDKTDSDWRDFNLSTSRAEKLILEKYGTKSDK